VRRVFVDPSYHVAVFNDDDDRHDRAMVLSRELAREPGTLLEARGAPRTSAHGSTDGERRQSRDSRAQSRD